MLCLEFFQRIEFASPATGAQPVASRPSPFPPFHLSILYYVSLPTPKRVREQNESCDPVACPVARFFFFFVLRSKYQQVKMASQNQTLSRTDQSKPEPSRAAASDIRSSISGLLCIWHQLHLLSTVSLNWEQAIKTHGNLNQS